MTRKQQSWQEWAAKNREYRLKYFKARYARMKAEGSTKWVERRKWQRDYYLANKDKFRAARQRWDTKNRVPKKVASILHISIREARQQLQMNDGSNVFHYHMDSVGPKYEFAWFATYDVQSDKVIAVPVMVDRIDAQLKRFATQLSDEAGAQLNAMGGLMYKEYDHNDIRDGANAEALERIIMAHAPLTKKALGQ